MKNHYVAISTSRTFPRWIVLYDTEAWRNETEPDEFGKKTDIHSLRLGWINAVHLNSNKEIIEDVWKFFTTPAEFYDFIETFKGEGKREPVYLFAHNTSYDFMLLGGMKHLPERGHVIKKNLIADTVFMLDTWLARKKTKKKSMNHFIWLDTMNFARNSLENIGNELGIPKTEPSGGKIDERTGKRVWTAKEWNKIPTDKMKEYCRNDVLIVRTFILEWIKFLEELDLGRFCKTIASQGLNSYTHGCIPTRKRKRDGKEVGIIVVHNDEHAVELERKKKQGGRTEIFFKGKRKGKYFLPDFTSLYPYIMRNLALPYKLDKTFDEVNKAKFEKIYADKDKLVIIDADVYMKEPIIPVKTDKLRFKTGYVRVTATTPEIDMLLETGGKVLKIYAMNVYSSYTGLFKTWVDKLFNKRLEFLNSEKEKNVFQYMVKILLNSLSGKWGQENEDWVKQLDKNGEPVEIDIEKTGWMTYGVVGKNADTGEEETEIIKVKSQLGFEWVKSKNKRLGFNTCLFLYDFITAYGRCLLYKAIRVAGKHNYFLSDTDSILVNQKGLDNLIKAGMVNQTGTKVLGMLESEDIYNEIEIRGLKDYTLVTLDGKRIVKMKGVRKDAFEVEADIYLQQKWLKPASLINKQNLEGMVVETIRKNVGKSRKTYDKGVVLKSGFINPIFEKKKLEEM